MAEKNCFDMTKLIIISNHVCHCGAVVKELLAPADKPGSTPGDTASVSLYSFFFFSCLVSFLTLFFFLVFFFILTADPAGQALGSILIF